MKMTTLCYIEKDNKYLMLHRVKKKNDINEGKWIGVGGHVEYQESPEECLVREVKEETGLTLTSWKFRGIVTFISEGWNTVIGENGSELSGGERQRISIARAFLKDAPIILLDEATASLDVDNETMIQESLSRLIKDKTVMIIAHRMRTVANADKIVVLKDGVVAESGTPSELDAKDGIYANMVKMQNLAADWAL